MKYFKIDESIDLDIVGAYPQVFPTENCELGSPFSNVRLIFGEIPEEIPYLELEFENGTKKTDFLSSYNTHWGIIVNYKLRKIIQKFNVPNYKFYPFILLKNKTYVKDYYLFRFYDNLFNYVDYERTKIEIFHKFNFSVLDEITLKSEEHLKEIKSSLKFEQEVRLKELYFNSNFPKYDIMINNILGFHTLISERLLSALQENNITGYEVSEYDILKIE